MKKGVIRRISIHAVELPLARPYSLSGGRLKFERLDSTLVRIETGDGRVGWGEGCPWGHTYGPAHGAGIRAAAPLLAPALLGQRPDQLDIINRIMDRTLPGHLYAKAPFDMACWDLTAQLAGRPLGDLLGGLEQEGAPIVSSLPTGDPDSMIEEFNEYRVRGYFVHSAKIGAHVADDIERVRRLEAHRAAYETVIFDVNRSWAPAQALQVMNAVPEVTAVFEQPCETLEECAQVRARTRQPISIDERLETVADLGRIIDGGIAEVVNIKVGRVGGLSKARLLRDLAAARGLRMLIMDTGGSAVADTAAFHLAQSAPPELCIGGWLCRELLSVDLAPGQGALNEKGRAPVPRLAGLGVVPDKALVGKPVQSYR